MRAMVLLPPHGEIRGRLYLGNNPDAEPPPWERLELGLRLMLWSEMAEDTYVSRVPRRCSASRWAASNANAACSPSPPAASACTAAGIS
jgi:hypothetical protein